MHFVPPRFSCRCLLPVLLCAAAWTTAAQSREPAGSSGSVPAVAAAQLEPVAVLATRLPTAIDEWPNTVWIVDSEQIEQQVRGGLSLQEMLGMLIPGLDLGGPTRTNFGQHLRGRPAQVMIDGVSLNGSRAISRQFDAIDPFNIERVEVLSGATSLYGGNATGGIINLVTRRADPAAPVFTSQAGVRSGLHGGDDFNWHAAQSIQGGNDRVRGRLSWVQARMGGLRDASGEPLIPDVTQADMQWNRTTDLMGSVDVDWLEQGTLKLLAQYYDSGVNTDRGLWLRPGPGNDILHPAELAVRDGFMSDVMPGTRRHLLVADYHHPDVLGGQALFLKLHQRAESMRFYPVPGLDLVSGSGPLVPYWGVSEQRTRASGVKFMLGKTWSRVRLNYGLDFDHERFHADQTLFDLQQAFASGGLVFQSAQTLGRYPSFTTRNWAGFVQAEVDLLPDLALNVGLRRQRVRVQVDDFVQAAQQRLVAAGFGASAPAIPGGTNRYTATLFNAGLVYAPTAAQQVWVNYAEGFELADPAKYYGIGADYALSGIDQPWQLLRYLSVADTSMAAIKTRSSEIGWRVTQGGWQWQAAGFHSRSDSLLDIDRATLSLLLRDAPVRNYGVEAGLSYHSPVGWLAGGNLLWLRTEQRDEGSWRRRGIFHASPSKFTVHAGWQAARWQARVQLAYRPRLKSDVGSFDGPAESLPSLTLVDVLGSMRFEHGPGVSGVLSAGVQNLFDRRYSTRWSEQAKLAYAGFVSPAVLDFRGQGRTLALTYTLQY